jgi:AcrR family transcriptional regulator
MSQRGSNVPLAEIAEAAGVGVGTFYRGYPDRTVLLHALEHRAYTLLHEVLHSPRQASCARSAGKRSFCLHWVTGVSGSIS